MREIVARRRAAKRMGLIKDPTGERLPDDLWMQALPGVDDDLAAIREELAKKIKPSSRPEPWWHGRNRGWDDCRASMLRALGGEG